MRALVPAPLLAFSFIAVVGACSSFAGESGLTADSAADPDAQFDGGAEPSVPDAGADAPDDGCAALLCSTFDEPPLFGWSKSLGAAVSVEAGRNGKGLHLQSANDNSPTSGLAYTVASFVDHITLAFSLRIDKTPVDAGVNDVTLATFVCGADTVELKLKHAGRLQLQIGSDTKLTDDLGGGWNDVVFSWSLAPDGLVTLMAGVMTTTLGSRAAPCEGIVVSLGFLEYGDNHGAPWTADVDDVKITSP